MSADQYAVMKELQARGVELHRPRWSRRRRVFVWTGSIAALLGAVLIVAIQRDRRHEDLRDLIRAAAERHQLDPAFVEAVVLAESNGNARAESHAGALGLMQLMIPTATEMAGRPQAEPLNREELFEPTLNLELGCRYLAYLGRLFDGDPRRILIAYNAGQGRLRGWERTGATTQEILDRHVPGETRAYVTRVLEFRRTITADRK